MSLSIGTPEPRRRAAPRKSAAKQTAPRRGKPAPAARSRTTAPHLPDAERLFRRFEYLLAEGEHAFSELEQSFREWCEVGDVTPPSRVVLAAWLKAAGLISFRIGRAKTTVYAKRAARLAA